MKEKIGFGSGDMLKSECSKCGGTAFEVKTDSGFAAIEELDNIIGWYYHLEFVCKRCGSTHDVVMGG